MNKRVRINKKGSTAVLLMLIFASILMVVGLFVYGSSQSARQNYLNSVFDLAGRSILSEFNIKLMEDYGLFAFYGEEGDIEDKLTYYTNSSFNKDNPGLLFRYKKNIDPLQIDLREVNIKIKEYSLANVDVFEDQILEYIKYNIAENLLTNKEFSTKNPDKEIILKNEQVILNLPSYGYKSSIIDVSRILDEGIPTLQEMKKKGTDNFYVNEYMLNTFQNHRKINEKRSTFFSNEIEYILSGEYDDKENYQKVRTNLVLLRTGLNLVHIYSDPTKREEIIALASVLTPGAGAAATQLVIAATWAGAEAENDLKLLEQGNNVALIKGPGSWALDLDGIMEGKKDNGAIEPEIKSGMTYKDYLRILLYFEKREIKLLRSMDLIQLNMEGSGDKDFLLKEHYGGLQIEAKIQDKMYKAVHKY